MTHTTKFFMVLFIGTFLNCDSNPKQELLNESFLEWKIEYQEDLKNPYDIEAYALFTHESGYQIKTPIFYSGYDQFWKFRFTGTKTGEWSFITKGPANLDGKTGTIQVCSDPEINRNGFLKSRGHFWYWEGNRRATVPQLVMLEDPSQFWNGNHPDTLMIREIVNEFIVNHGFTGFHLEGGGYWFNIHQSILGKRGDPVWPDSSCLPDERTFAVYETIIKETYKKGGLCYLWLWGSDNSGTNRSGPDLIGGHMSDPYKRLLKYIAARLGPIPGWFMGYGYDLDRWVGDYFGDLVGAAKRLEEWKDSFEIYLGDWQHLLGGRAHPGVWQDYPRHHMPPDSLFWYGDFASYVNFRPAYSLYEQCIQTNNNLPHLQGDRYRIRERERYAPKDYNDPGMVVRGLWHSTLAGGVGNIWGNLTHPDGNFNTGTVYGKPVRIKSQIKTYHTFWFEKNRFLPGMITDNSLTEYQKGKEQLQPDESGAISVALRDSSNKNFIFYSEHCRQIRMDLDQMQGNQPAIAVDIRREYQEIMIGSMSPDENMQLWEAPYTSDWALAIGTFNN